MNLTPLQGYIYININININLLSFVYINGSVSFGVYEDRFGEMVFAVVVVVLSINIILSIITTISKLQLSVNFMQFIPKKKKNEASRY